jgi:23S rRNA (uridine2552-2'-O)-methyltransferase
MAPKATGHRFTDQIRASDLAEKAVYFAQKYLSFKGSFVCKLLGANTNDTLIKDIKKQYKEVKLFKPKSSMKDSKEIYLVCLGFNNLQ